MRGRRKSKYHATDVPREKLRANEAESDIVFETVEEALPARKRAKEENLAPDWFY